MCLRIQQRTKSTLHSWIICMSSSFEQTWLQTAYICLWFSLMKNTFCLWFTEGQDCFFNWGNGWPHIKYVNCLKQAGSVVLLNFKCQALVSRLINVFPVADSSWHINTGQKGCGERLPFKMCLTSCLFLSLFLSCFPNGSIICYLFPSNQFNCAVFCKQLPLCC